MRPLKARIEDLEAQGRYWEFQMGLEEGKAVFVPTKSQATCTGNRLGYVIFKIVFNHLNMLQ